MKVSNIHKRLINQPKSVIVRVFNTLATDNDMMLATDKWPPMKLNKGLQVGSKGGHGPIRYFVTEFNPEKSIAFQFDMKGFNGSHRFDITPVDTNRTELSHIVDLTTTGSASYYWAFAIRWLHDAYIEDAFDKVENHFTENKKSSEWSIWVKLLRKIMKPKRKKLKHNSLL